MYKYSRKSNTVDLNTFLPHSLSHQNTHVPLTDYQLSALRARAMDSFFVFTSLVAVSAIATIPASSFVSEETKSTTDIANHEKNGTGSYAFCIIS